MSAQDFLSYLNMVLMIGIAVGGFFAIKKGYNKEATEIQERVINALKEEVTALHGKVDDLERERATQDRVIATIRYAMLQYGLRVTIAGDFVTLKDSKGNAKTTQVQKVPVNSPLEDDDGGEL